MATTSAPAKKAGKKSAPLPILDVSLLREATVYKSESSGALFQIQRLTPDGKVYFFQPKLSGVGHHLEEPLHGYKNGKTDIGDFTTRHRINTSVGCSGCKAGASEVLCAHKKRSPLCLPCASRALAKQHPTIKLEGDPPAAPRSASKKGSR